MFAFKSLLNMPRFEAIAVALALVAAMGYTIISLFISRRLRFARSSVFPSAAV